MPLFTDAVAFSNRVTHGNTEEGNVNLKQRVEELESKVD